MIWEPILKTTIDITDDLARTAKAHAARQNTTLRALIERGLRLVLRADRRETSFQLREAGVTGNGLKAPYSDSDWARIRESIYEGRGN